jgi:hypothetical protein
VGNATFSLGPQVFRHSKYQSGCQPPQQMQLLPDNQRITLVKNNKKEVIGLLYMMDY